MQQLGDSDPRRLGNYRLSARLGSGGMGVVYLGYTRAGTPVAVKVIHGHLVNDPTVRNRFRREIDAAIRVSSRYTARVLDADPSADQPFLVTEFVAGLTLFTKVIEDGGLDLAATTAVAAGVAAGIAAIHGVGVVHRDLTPNNVMLTVGGPRIIDLGVAWVDDATTVTQTGGLIGTPAYMAPEVIRGQAIGPAADIFAWGALVCFAAMGTSPFGSGPTHAMLYRIVHDNPDLDELVDPLRDVVAAALSKAPSERPSAALLVRQITDSSEVDDDRTVQTAVATLVAQTENLAADVTTPIAAPLRSRRRRRLMTGLAAAVILAAGLAGGAWMLQVRAEQSPMSATSTSRAEPSERSKPALTVTTSPGPSATRPEPSAPPAPDVPSAPASAPEPPPAPEPEPVIPALNADTRIGLRGIGPIEAGMTIAEAEEVAGVSIVAQEFTTFGGSCYYAYAEGLEDDVDFLVESPGPGPVLDPRDGVITRVSATQHMASPAQTLSGIGIGDSEDDVYSTYPGQIEEEPHLYVPGGHYLRFVPRDPEDRDFGLVFFTDGDVVLEIHAGDAIASGYVEGCA